jgi:SPP1 gp7 family putative phage head morphogenesis protein
VIKLKQETISLTNNDVESSLKNIKSIMAANGSTAVPNSDVSIWQNSNIAISADVAVNMAIRQLFTEIFTPYSVVSSIPGMREVPENVKQEVSDLIDKHIKDLQLAFSDFILTGKCYLWQLNRISATATSLKERSHFNEKLGRVEYFLSYVEQRNIAAKWWENDSLTNVTINIAPEELHNQLDEEFVKYDEKYLSKFVNPIPIHDTIKKLADQKNILALQVMPMMAQKAVIPTVAVITPDGKSATTASNYLSNWQNLTRVVIPGDPDKVKLEVLSIGKDIPTDLINSMLHYYTSAIFMGLGTSISTIQASGQELTTSRTVDRNILRIVQGYQDEIERWIAEQLTKIDPKYEGIWIKFTNPDPDWELNLLEKAKIITELKEAESIGGYDFSSLIDRIFPSNENGEILASAIDISEKEVESLLKSANAKRKGLDYISDETKRAELEKKAKSLSKLFDNIDIKGDRFGRDSFNAFKKWLEDNFNPRTGISDELLNTFTQTEVDAFFSDFVAPFLNAEGIYSNVSYDEIDRLKTVWVDTFKNNYSSYTTQLNDVLNDGIRKGLDEVAITNNLKEVTKGLTADRLQLRARQELSKTYNLARAKSMWYEPVVYVNAEDDQVRPAHRKLNGLVFIPSEHPELVPPLGYNCRCSITPYRG